MEDNFRIKKNLHVYFISDAHIGSSTFNEDYFDYMVSMIHNDNHKKVVYCLGDLIESASKEVGDSAFKQNLDVNEEIDLAIDYLKPISKYINGYCGGNHEYRLQKHFNFNINHIIAKNIGVEETPNIQQTLTINNQPFNVFGQHGRGSASKEHLALGKIQRDLNWVNADLYAMGHIHRCGSIETTYVENNIYKKRMYVITGHFLGYGGSYAEDNQLSPSPEAFARVSVTPELDKYCDIYSIDKVAPELMM